MACGLGLIVWTALDGAPDIAWPWAFVSGAMHVPYIVLLSRAYNRGDFSMSYPIVRGAGALAGALGVIASIVSTTMIVVGKLTRVEVMLAELRAQMTGYEHRISQLERRLNEQP